MRRHEGARSSLRHDDARRAVRAVLRGEGISDACVSLTFVTAPRMRSLNRRAFGRNRVTDVIAFPLRHGERLVGDVYVSPAAARQSAASLGIASREEELRLIVHGVLHVLGFDHPGGRSRQGSAMWRRQEQYVRQLTRRDA